MSKQIRQKIALAIHNTFRSSASPRKQSSTIKSKISSSCCSVTKPQDYEYIPYQSKPSSSASSLHNDYVDLSECHSWSSRDSGISFDSNISSLSSISQHHHQQQQHQQLQSTRTHADDSCSLSTLSDVSVIPHDEMNISNFDVTGWHSLPESLECCHCECHHHVDNIGDNDKMFEEKWQDFEQARGIDEVACDTPITPPPVSQPSIGRKTPFPDPHR
ncbi:unnamed protein product [Adineta ricciae]|uniref:Uncharacterized protein n=1 Tax=Adineta ricciae TaxID=249248 RepID=A0A815GG55_ADIRI|nr:unnamed protein product [Adineta ricciae]